MNARTLLSGVVAVTLLAAAATGCAMLKRQSPEDVVAERQQLMKRQAAAFKDIQEKAKAGDIRGIAPSADKIVGTSQRIPSLFPEGSITAKSNAKPEIWQKRAEFESLAKKLNADAASLQAAATANDANATQVIVRDLGRTTCGACHTTFRKPLPPQ